MRYFEIDGKPCRSLQFDRNLLGMANREDRGANSSNIFVRNIPKDLKHTDLEDKYQNYGKVKSLKVSLNQDHTSRGYGFIQFADEESAVEAVKSMGEEKEMQAIVFQPRDAREFRKLVNNIYVKNIPKETTE